MTKWVEAIPTRKASHNVVIDFLLSNILSRFTCPRKIITDNAKAFTLGKLVKFCNDYNIILSHSTAYYPQGNGLAKSSNKSLLRTIKKILQDNKNAWHAKLIYALWENRVSTKKSIGTSPFQLVYGTDVVFLEYLGMPIMKYIQEGDSEPNPTQRRMNQLIELHQVKEGIFENTRVFKEKMKQVLTENLRKIILT